MTLFHSCNSVQQVAHLLRLVQSKEDAVVYCTPYVQNDYGRFIVKFDAQVSDEESYDQGGISLTGNVAIPARSIKINTMEVL